MQGTDICRGFYRVDLSINYLPEGDAAAGEDILALGALGGDFVLEALYTVDVLVVRNYEGLASHLSRRKTLV